MSKIKKLVKSRWRFKLFLMSKLPMAFIAGVNIIEYDGNKAVVSVPFNFLNKNPFRSVYFAVLSMGAELSSGIIALDTVTEADSPVSMLVLNMRARFIKKAKTDVLFVCNEGDKIRKAVKRSVETGEGVTVEVLSEGFDKKGEKVASFRFEWTFKTKV